MGQFSWVKVIIIFEWKVLPVNEPITLPALLTLHQVGSCSGNLRKNFNGNLKCLGPAPELNCTVVCWVCKCVYKLGPAALRSPRCDGDTGRWSRSHVLPPPSPSSWIIEKHFQEAVRCLCPAAGLGHYITTWHHLISHREQGTPIEQSFGGRGDSITALQSIHFLCVPVGSTKVLNIGSRSLKLLFMSSRVQQSTGCSCSQ